MGTSVRYMTIGVISAAVFPAAIVLTAPSASADCNTSGYATVCAQGTVTGGSAPVVGPVYPGYCADPWYCNDDWGIDIDLSPGRPNRPGGPGGGGGGIGPR